MSYQSVDKWIRLSHYHEERFRVIVGSSKASHMLQMVSINHDLQQMYLHYVQFKGMMNMAKKPSAPTTSTWKGYANVEISGDHVELIEAYAESQDKVWDDTVTAMTEGYKLSVDYVSKDDTFKATLTCNDINSQNAGLSLSAWSDSAFEAIACVMFKHLHIAQRKWTQKTKGEKRKFG